jgi:beta-phosphoglucomutase-like phosphatase (HAD superfamily)
MVHVSGNDVKRRKPAPDLFLLAAERLEIEPGRCVVIEDAPDGVRAAKAAGAKCIAVTNTTTPDKLAEADLICDSLEQINLDVIQELIDSNRPGFQSRCPAQHREITGNEIGRAFMEKQ